MQVIEAIQSENLLEVNQLLNKAIKGDSLDDLYLLADSLYQLGFLEETKIVLNHLLDEQPSDDEIRINLAEIAIEEGHDLKAIDYLNDIQEDSSAYVQSLLVAADYYQTQQLPEVSESKLKKAKEMMPNEPIILFGLGELYYSMGQYNQAIHNYEEILRLGVNEVANINLNARIGTAYSGYGEFEKAVKYLQEAVDEKEDIDTLFNLGITYFQMNEFTRAIECFKHVQSLDHTYTSIYPYLALALDEEMRQDEAAQAVSEGVRLDTMNTELYIIGAKIHIKRGELNQANEYFDKAYELNPNSETTLIEYANFLIYIEKYSDAIELVSQALEEEQVDPQFYWVLANAHNYEEDYSEARYYYEKAYDNFYDNRYFLKDYSLFLQEEGDKEKLQTVVQNYLEIDPSDIEFKDILLRLENEY